MSGGKQAAADKPAGRGRVYLMGLACGAVATLATPTAALASALLLPSLAASFMEAAPGRPLARCMVLFGIAAALPDIVGLWRGPGNLAAALEMALDLHDVAQAWAAQAAGWLLAEGIPIVGALIIDAANGTRARLLRHERARIAEEWALPPPPDP